MEKNILNLIYVMLSANGSGCYLYKCYRIECNTSMDESYQLYEMELQLKKIVIVSMPQ